MNVDSREGTHTHTCVCTSEVVGVSDVVEGRRMGVCVSKSVGNREERRTVYPKGKVQVLDDTKVGDICP